MHAICMDAAMHGSILMLLLPLSTPCEQVILTSSYQPVRRKYYEWFRGLHYLLWPLIFFSVRVHSTVSPVRSQLACMLFIHPAPVVPASSSHIIFNLSNTDPSGGITGQPGASLIWGSSCTPLTWRTVGCCDHGT